MTVLESRERLDELRSRAFELVERAYLPDGSLVLREIGVRLVLDCLAELESVLEQLERRPG